MYPSEKGDAALLVVVLAVLALQPQYAHADGRYLVFTQWHPLNIRIGDVPDSLEPSKRDMKEAVEKRVEKAGFLAKEPKDLILRFRVVEMWHLKNERVYMVDGQVFHRMDGHEYGNGYVSL